MSKEFKHYELRSASRMGKSIIVGTTASIVMANGDKFYCYIRFSDSFVRAVGKKLPRGVSALDPAYIVIYEQRGVFEVWARYVSDAEGVMLWSAPEMPSWVKLIPIRPFNLSKVTAP